MLSRGSGDGREQAAPGAAGPRRFAAWLSATPAAPLSSSCQERASGGQFGKQTNGDAHGIGGKILHQVRPYLLRLSQTRIITFENGKLFCRKLITNKPGGHGV